MTFRNMKHVINLLLVPCLAISLSACGISQADYDALLTENNALKSEIDSLSSELDTLVTEKESLSAEVESLSAQVESLSEYKKEQVLSILDDAYVIAWATTSFGDNSICFTNGDTYFQCIAENTYVISEEGISELWSDVLKSVTTLGALSENIKYETISIKFLNPSGIYILDVILKKNGNSCSLEALMCNALYSEQIGSALNNLSAN